MIATAGAPEPARPEPPGQTQPEGKAGGTATAGKHAASAGEAAALHACVGAEVTTLRGLSRSVAAALKEPDVELGADARRGHGEAAPHVQGARRALLGGQYRKARAEVRAAREALAPALAALGRQLRIPAAACGAVGEHASRGRAQLDGARASLGADTPAGLGALERANSELAAAAQGAAAPGCHRALHSLSGALGSLDEGIAARWPAVR